MGKDLADRSPRGYVSALWDIMGGPVWTLGHGIPFPYQGPTWTPKPSHRQGLPSTNQTCYAQQHILDTGEFARQFGFLNAMMEFCVVRVGLYEA